MKKSVVIVAFSYSFTKKELVSSQHDIYICKSFYKEKGREIVTLVDLEIIDDHSNMLYSTTNLKSFDNVTKMNLLEGCEDLVIYYTGHCSYKGMIEFVSGEEIHIDSFISKLIYGLKLNSLTIILDCCNSNFFKLPYIYDRSLDIMTLDENVTLEVLSKMKDIQVTLLTSITPYNTSISDKEGSFFTRSLFNIKKSKISFMELNDEIKYGIEKHAYRYGRSYKIHVIIGSAKIVDTYIEM